MSVSSTDFVGPPLGSEPGMGALTLGGFIREVCDRHADREAVCLHEQDGTVLRWSYAQLREEAAAISRALLAAGVGEGTRVALLMGNRPEWVAAAYGVTAIGAVLVPVNTFFIADELGYVLAHSDAAVLLCQEALAGHHFLDDVASLQPRLPWLREVVCLGTGSWKDFLARGDEVAPEHLSAVEEAVSPQDDALVIYTSGTTARPKAVLHAHRAPAVQSWRFARHLCLDADTRSWSAFPYFWTAGFCMVMGGTLAAGGCLVQQERFEPGAALALLEAERVTTPYAWPHQSAALEDHPDWEHTDLSALRHVEAFSPFGRHPSVTRTDDDYSPRSAYGATETFTIVSSLPSDTPAEIREGNHGAILPGVTLRIVDPATGAAQAVGQAGEIRVKGATLMKGYLKIDPGETFDADGFFATGDAGFVDADGMLHWTGRTTDLIKTGGANVSPVEVEEVLLRNPQLGASIVVGVPHETLGQIVVLLTAPHDANAVGEAVVREWLRGRISSYKIPRRVLFVDETDLIKTGNAKLRADEARALAQRLLADDDDVSIARSG
jgi:acyl-CoA synthetase (AMP-forming)/AMP-acid ligase II